MHGFFESFRQAPSKPEFPIFPEQKTDFPAYKLKDTTILDFNTLEPIARSYQVINPFYASDSTSMVSHDKITSVEAIMKQASASEAAIYRTLIASPGVELPFLQPLGVAKEDPTLLNYHALWTSSNQQFKDLKRLTYLGISKLFMLYLHLVLMCWGD